MKICYQEKNFRTKSLEMIKLCNEIIEEFSAQGFELTLRQLYYQLVSRAVIPNNEKSYDNIGALISDARLAGLVDWEAIVDRTRYLRALSHWNDPSEVIEDGAQQYRVDCWADQPKRLEVWVEKDALVDVIGKVANQFDVPFFSCRGYTSQSEMYGAAQRLVNYQNQGQSVVIIHLGDHDPSGIDMSRDIEDRLTMFCEYHGAPDIALKRLALNKPQILAYKPPPNPAKLTDCRAVKYIEQHGNESWELDALNPKVIADMIRAEINKHLDKGFFAAAQEKQRQAREELQRLADNYVAALDGAAKAEKRAAKRRKKAK